MTTVAVLGLGAMGSRIAGRLLDHSYDLVVWNRTSSKAEPLVHAGARSASTPKEAAGAADAVITMLADPDALAAVSPGIAAGIKAGSTVIEMSTVGPEPITQLRKALPEHAGLIDAPVLGSIDAVEAGTLIVFAAGDTEEIDRWEPLLKTLGTVVRVGGLGSGAAAKLVANSTLFPVLCLLGETIALADRLGLDRKTTFNVLEQTVLGPQIERRRPMIESREYPSRFALRLGRKDAALITEAARGADLKVMEAARAWLEDAQTWDDRDYASVISWIIEHA